MINGVMKEDRWRRINWCPLELQMTCGGQSGYTWWSTFPNISLSTLERCCLVFLAAKNNSVLKIRLFCRACPRLDIFLFWKYYLNIFERFLPIWKGSALFSVNPCFPDRITDLARPWIGFSAIPSLVAERGRRRKDRRRESARIMRADVMFKLKKKKNILAYAGCHGDPLIRIGSLPSHTPPLADTRLSTGTSGSPRIRR